MKRYFIYIFVGAILSIFPLTPFTHTALASELIGHWKFDESSGSAVDSAGNHDPLTNNNSVTYDEGVYGNAAYFNGSNQYFSGVGPDLNGQSFTFSAWLWRDSDAVNERIYFSLGDTNDGQNHNMHLRVGDDGFMRFGFLSNDLDAPSGTFVEGQWNHVVLTYDADTNERKIYLNGGAAKASDTSPSDFLGDTLLNIGRWSNGAQYWDGRIDDLKIYNRALTQDEITDIAEGGAGPGLLGIDEFNPTDNATGVSVTANLVATFSTSTVATSTGSIGIYKTSDDSLVESIAVSSSQITKNGADITINPSVTLADNTEYYVWIPSTAFKDADDVFYEGTTASSTWSFTTVADSVAPVISNIAVSDITNSGATITWTTDEAASTKVVYGLVSSMFAVVTTETDTSPRVTSHSKTISNFAPCTTYQYAVISRDALGNSATSTDASLNSTGCEYEGTPTQATSTNINAGNTGTTNLTEDGKTFVVTANAPTSTSLVIQIKALPSTSVLATLGSPSSAPNEVGATVFDVKAIVNGDTIFDSFDTEVTIEYEYTEEEISNIDESTLWLYHYTGGEWVALNDCTVNTSANTISCTTPSFSIFGLFGNLPTQSASRSSSYTSTTLSGQIRNLLDNGNVERAWELVVMYPFEMQKYIDLHIEVLRAVLTKLFGVQSFIANEVMVRDLEVGMEGEDVRKLQQILNAQGYLLAETGSGSPGQETTLFGALTKQALANYQASKGISPAVGYFGPFTRTQMKLSNLLGIWW